MDYTNNEIEFLCRYYQVEAALGKHCPKARVIDSLCKIHCLDKKRKAAMRKLVDLEDVADILTLADYRRTMRALTYTEHYGVPLELSDDVRFALDCKGKALGVVEALTMGCGKDPTRTQLIAGLRKPTLCNNVAILALCAFLYYEGIVLPLDRAAAKQCADKCLRWNDVGGILMLLHYGDADVDALSSLRSIVEYKRCAEDYAAVFARYGAETHEVEAPALLATYFEHNADQVDTYDAMVADIVRTPFLSVGDKRRILSSSDKSLVAHVCDLAVGGEIHRFDPRLHLRALLAQHREGEANQVEVYLRKQNTEMGRIPLLVCSDSIAIHNYLQAIHQFVGKDDVTYIGGKTVARNSFAPTKSNVIIQALLAKNSVCNVFVVTDVDCLAESDAVELAAMVNPLGRKSYLLRDVGFPVDLSNSVFLLCASGEIQHPDLRKVCHSIAVCRATQEESLAYVQKVIDRSKEIYECANLSFDQQAVAFLAERNADYVNSVVESVVGAHTYLDEACVVTKETIIATASHIGDRNMAFAIK